MFSIKTKIIFSYTFLFGIILSLFSFIIYQDIQQTQLERLDANLDKYCMAVKEKTNQVAGEQTGENTGNFNNDPSNISSFDFKDIPQSGLHDTHLQIFTIDGKLVVKDSLLSNYYRQSNRKINTLPSTVTEVINGNKFRIYRSPIEIEDDTLYAAEIAASLAPIYESMHRLFALFLLIIPLALVLTGFTAYIISKAAFKPITKMAKTAKLISASNLDKRLELPRANDEVKMLGETLNGMIERIDAAFKSQRQFIANASHEIKTPLTIIYSELQLALRDLKNNESEESIRIALAEIEHLTTLTNSLLTLISLDSVNSQLRIEKFRLDELLIDSIHAMYQTAMQKLVTISLTISGAVELSGDKEKLKRVFENLIDNAIKYSKKNGSLRVELKNVSNGKAEIIFSDAGIGINSNEIDKIFERFYRSDEIKSSHAGSGLGLAIAKEIVGMHHGEIKVRSELGKGTEVTVILPT